jgi:2-polyprenyl-3-methyl-5-hydroxy-6-metoxy-1,4-benzoquinol methylase
MYFCGIEGTMKLPQVFRAWLRPAIAPIRAAVTHKVTALVDARVSELATQRAPELSDILTQQQLLERQARLFALVDERSHPNTDELWVLLRDLNNAKLTIKFFGYELGRALSAALPPRTGLLPGHVGLHSKPSTQADLESDWAAYWISELKTAHLFHRKLWEFAYVLQAIYESGNLSPGARGLGFGCGEEPLPSYFANHGINITVTDLDPNESAARGWIDTNQHTSSLNMVYQEHLVSREKFDRHVSLRYVDMNAIPSDLRDYDFCWSICALEHIGTIQKGLDFIENSLDTIRPGGVAIHTTEFNFLNDEQTIDDWPTVLYQKQHFRQLADRLERQGCHVAPLDFDVGDKPLDKFIDVPPYQYNWSAYQREIWNSDIQHLKVTVDGFACTCFGVIIRKS